MKSSMKQRIKNARSYVDQRKGQANIIRQNIKEKTDENAELTKSLHDHEQALEIIKEVGKKTQEKLQYHISEITSLALEAVFDDSAYKLEVRFVERRDKMECDLVFVNNKGQEMDPLESTGGGAVDVASFALRIASWSLTNPKTRNVIILDEPLRFLDKQKQEKASLMIKEISKKLNLQFIIVTHEDKLTEAADKVFRVSIDDKRVSHVK